LIAIFTARAAMLARY